MVKDRLRSFQTAWLINNRFNSRIYTGIVVSGLLALVGCTSNPLDVDVSGVSVELKTYRLDQRLFAPVEDIGKAHERLVEEVPEAYDIYLQDVVGLGSTGNRDVLRYLEGFTQDGTMQEIYQEIQSTYGDLETLNAQFENAFKHYKYHFPDSACPSIFYWNSGFNYGVYPLGNDLGVGLDMYLGSDNELLKRLPPEVFPQYRKDKMVAQNIVPNALLVFLGQRFYEGDHTSNFAQKLIANGKLMYLLDACLPNVPDHVKIGFTPAGIEWCAQNEYHLWKTVYEREMLFKTNDSDANKWFMDGPFTAGLSQESPPMVGIWLGWRIVRNFAEETGVGIQELLDEKNVQRILKYYQPSI